MTKKKEIDKELDVEGFRKEAEPFLCPHCGHNEAKLDSFAQLKGVKRVTPGNVICAKCFKPIAAKATF